MASNGLLVIILITCGALMTEAQLGLLSVHSSGFAFRSTLPGGDNAGAASVPPIASPLLAQLSDRRPEPARHGSSNTMESEIAAIFRAAAYGGSTTQPTTTSTTTTTTTPGSTTSMTTIASVKIPLFKTNNEVYNNEESNNIMFVSSTSHPKAEVNHVQSVSYYVQEDDEPSDNLNLNQNSESYTLSDIIENIKPVVTSPTSVFVTHKVRATEPIVIEQYPMNGVRYTLGAGWWIHVYVSAGLFALLAAASFCLLGRISYASIILPKGLYMILHVLVLIASMIRCIHLFHDPYGVESRLPLSLLSAVEETSWPCLTAALAVLVMGVVQASRGSPRLLPRFPRAPLILAVLTAGHLSAIFASHLALPLLPDYSHTIAALVKTFTAAWAMAVGLGGLWCVWRVLSDDGHQPGQLLGRLPGFSQHGTAHTKTGLMMLLASLAEIALAVVQIYSLLFPLNPSLHAWAWWGRVSLARGLEILMGLSLLLTAAILTHGRKAVTKNDDNIFTVFTNSTKDSNIRNGRSDNVFPIQNDKNVLGSFTVKSGMNGSLDDTLDIKHHPMNWNGTVRKGVSYNCTNPRGLSLNNACCTTPRNITKVPHPKEAAALELLLNREQARAQMNEQYRSSMLVNDSGFLRFRTDIDLKQEVDDIFRQSSFDLYQPPKTPDSAMYTNINHYSQTLPHNHNGHYYCTPLTQEEVKQISPIKHNARSNTVRAPKPNPRSPVRHHHVHTTTTPTHRPVTSVSKYDVRAVDDYDVASYYNNSMVSGNSNMYSTPHIIVPRNPMARSEQDLPFAHTPTQQDEYSQIAQQGSVDGLSTVLEPSTCSSLSEIHVDYLTDISSSNDAFSQGSLPPVTKARHSNNALTLPLTSPHFTYTNSLPVHSTPITTKNNQPDITPDSAVVLDYTPSTEYEDDVDHDGKNKPLDLLKLSTSSLNDALKGQSRASLMYKLVGSSMSGYSPLDVDETSSPSQEYPVKVHQGTSIEKSVPIIASKISPTDLMAVNSVTSV